jgi:hypothetical protein
LLGNSAGMEEVLRTLVVAGLLYSLPIFLEARMSPQLHYWFYGYYPSQFLQQMRTGGFRPTVFIGHGLSVAFFIMTATVAATALWRTQTRVQWLTPAGVFGYLSGILILCKALTSLLYGAVAVPLVRLTKPRLQLHIAMLLVSIAVLYPAFRAGDLVPIDHILAAANSISEERADSLKFRFDNEQQLLDRASQRIWFGWGRYGRSRIFDEWGSDISVTDGRWIVTLGQFGLFGFLSEFGLLAWTVFRAGSGLRFVASERDCLFLAVLALIVSITMIDMLPNATLTPWTWLLAGALLGRTESARTAARRLRQSDRLNSVAAQEEPHIQILPTPGDLH